MPSGKLLAHDRRPHLPEQIIIGPTNFGMMSDMTRKMTRFLEVSDQLISGKLRFRWFKTGLTVGISLSYSSNYRLKRANYSVINVRLMSGKCQLCAQKCSTEVGNCNWK